MEKQGISILLEEWTDELMHNISENTASCIILLDDAGKLVFANNAVETLFDNFNYKKLMNPSFKQLQSIESTKNRIFTGFLTIGENHLSNSSIVAEVYRKNNKYLIIGGVNASQLLEQNETMHHLNREITTLQRKVLKEKRELTQTLEKLNEANKELAISNATKDKFFDIIAHDLKNPFSSILGFSKLLTERFDKFDKNSLKNYTDVIHSSAQNAFKLLANLLEWSRAQTGKIQFKPSVIRIQNVIIETIALVQNMANEKSITIEAEAASDIFVYADHNMLDTIMRNLLSNAVKFTYPGGKIIVSAKETGNNKVRISVKDNGTGMSPEKLEHLFDISKKVSSMGTNKEKGTGLGLLLCKEFAEQHGSTISVQSELEKGSTFSFELSKEINQEKM